ncbi:MAG: hypothetical protein LWY06_13400 [Firmicutes bacterium]|nr:hypothetical protein [Bacillota bacterium]
MKSSRITGIIQQAFLFLLVLITPILLVSGCGSFKNDDKDDASPTESTVTIDTNGGTYALDDIFVEFPKRSVNDEIKVSGTTVDLTVPSHIIPLTKIHKITLSDSSMYNPFTATINFSVTENTEKAHIYYSKDGINWYNLGGNVLGPKISAKTHKFQYFFAGRSVESSNDTFTVNITNNTPSFAQFCLYMTSENNENNIYSVAWLSKKIKAESQDCLQWTNSYSFFWTPIGDLNVGSMVMPAQTLQGDIIDNNLVTLMGSEYSYFFTQTSPGPTQGNMFIEQATNIYLNQASTGICISEAPVFISEAMPNYMTIYNTSGCNIYLAAIDAVQGEVIDPQSIENPLQIQFSSGSRVKNVTLNADYSWSVTDGN